MESKIIYIDLDCLIEDGKFVEKYIQKINKKYDQGNTIIIWTNNENQEDELFLIQVYNQLQNINCKFHQLKSGKPVFDIIVDKNSTGINFFK